LQQQEQQVQFVVTNVLAQDQSLLNVLVMMLNQLVTQIANLVGVLRHYL
jgi:hypothetical protein